MFKVERLEWKAHNNKSNKRIWYYQTDSSFQAEIQFGPRLGIFSEAS